MNKEQWIKWFKLALAHKTILWKAGLAAVLIAVGLTSYAGHTASKQAEMLAVINAEAGQPYENREEFRTEPEEKADIIVDIGGAVCNPGIVKLKEGNRVYDAVEAAGGLSKDADTSAVNLAAYVSDGDKVLIPGKQQEQDGTGGAGIVTSAVSNGSGGQGGTAEANAQVNINRATSEQLQTLSGVGPATAQKIIDYRESSGGFKKPEDLMNVSGIGTKTFEKIKSRLSV